ncbi:hypothetical protein Dda_9473 [Drechslerella dactyloides]|uniref:Uncharacterized protein n=1 Tax=Drechslerella dactyloides TaxID=74499 RepID=A0AAD6ISW5_DREDA|nr:hypothetical protein Dda_9473 [Drechslerella dactyloides]
MSILVEVVLELVPELAPALVEVIEEKKEEEKEDGELENLHITPPLQSLQPILHPNPTTLPPAERYGRNKAHMFVNPNSAGR